MSNTDFPLLFSPLAVGSMTVKNRCFMPAMTTNLCDTHNCVTPELIAYYVARAKGGVGLITAEATMVEPYSHYRGLTNMGLYDDSQIAGMSKLAGAVHQYGTKLIVQLMHGGPACLPEHNAGRLPRAASPIAIRTGWLQGTVPLEATEDEISAYVQDFAEAALRAKKAGLDGVEIHACHRHGLVGSFLSPLSNRRIDAYGGGIHGRLRFLLEILRAVRAATGPDFALFVRISTEELEAGGQSLLETIQIARELEKNGADMLNLSRGTTETFWITVAPNGSPKALHSELAQKVRDAVHIPVGVAGRITEPWIAELVLNLGRADAVYLGRALLCDPDFMQKAAQGVPESIRPCMGCTDCICRLNGPVIHCSLNPAAARETVALQPAHSPKNLMVVGGGPAGLHAATIAAQRGHHVSLWDAATHLGGQMYLAGIPNGKQDLTQSVQYLVAEAKRAGVELHAGTCVTADFVRNHAPDAVILATGARPVTPKFLPADSAAVQAVDVLAGKATAGRNVVILGGGTVGCELAEFLTHPRNDMNPSGRHVTVIEMASYIMEHDRSYARTLLVERMMQKGIVIETSARVTDITDSTVTYTQKEKDVTLEGIDTIILALGVVPQLELRDALEGGNIPVHVIGDADKPGRILSAMQSAQLLGELV